MKNLLTVCMSVSVLFAVTFLGGCASVVSGDVERVRVITYPSEAVVTVTDDRGYLLYKGVTPANISMRKSPGFFERQDFNMLIERERYESVYMALQGVTSSWYVAGNALLLPTGIGLLGWLVIDPYTGAMWTYEPHHVELNLLPSKVN